MGSRSRGLEVAWLEVAWLEVAWLEVAWLEVAWLEVAWLKDRTAAPLSSAAGACRDLRIERPAISIIATIHNLALRGIFGKQVMPELGDGLRIAWA